MKNITIIILIITLNSCTNFTDVGLPSDQITREVVFKDEALANSAMAAIYRSAEQYGFLSGSYSGANIFLGCYTDELISHENTSSDLSQYFFLAHSPSTSHIYSIWSVTYNQIYNINSVIEGLQHSTLSNSFKNKLTGEALLMRAYLHLALSNYFGDVPYITTTDYTVNAKVKRESVSTVYHKVQQDLYQASLILPTTLPAGSRIRPTKDVAFALLARLAYLQKDWNKAIEYSEKLINNSAYTMEVDLEKLFLKNSSSAIWQLLPYDNTYNTMEGNLFIISIAPPTTVSLNPQFVNSFEINDLRKIEWVGNISDNQNNTYYFPHKYKEANNTANSIEYSIIIRIEEIYLIRAEAYVHQNMFGLALNDINKIRTRANLPNLQISNKELLLEAILNERRFELFAEFGHRFEDLKHFGKLEEVMLLNKSNWKSHFRLLPIPENELLLNPNLSPQNDGY